MNDIIANLSCVLLLSVGTAMWLYAKGQERCKR